MEHAYVNPTRKLLVRVSSIAHLPGRPARRLRLRCPDRCRML